MSMVAVVAVGQREGSGAGEEEGRRVAGRGGGGREAAAMMELVGRRLTHVPAE